MKTSLYFLAIVLCWHSLTLTDNSIADRSDLCCSDDKQNAADFGRLGLDRVCYCNPGLVVDLGVGLWGQPLPMDYDSDGDYDLVVSCNDVPYNGTYFFENPGGGTKMPTFKRAVRIGPGMRNLTICYVNGQPCVMAPAVEFLDFSRNQFNEPHKLPLESNIHDAKARANQWKQVDFDADGHLDLIVGVGDWTDYGWDNAYDENGEWTRGPLHGYVYLIRNAGTTENPQYGTPIKLQVDGQPIDVFGMPSPNMADFDGDGDLDLLCGNFVDKLTYFENVGTRAGPRFSKGRRLMRGNQPLRIDLCMFVPVAIDWDHDGDFDLVIGQEDGRVMLVEHTGRVQDGLPQYEAPRFFQQEAAAVKFGALVTPVSVDWDSDGDADLVCGNTAGQIGLIENLDGGNPPKWAAPKLLEAGGTPIRIEAGRNGSIQGPAEEKWGYTTLCVADWDHDGLLDLVVNSIWGKVIWFRNVGTRVEPKLAAAQPIEVQWHDKPPKPAWTWWQPKAGELVTQWRTTPLAVDFNEDGLNDLVMLDHEGYLVLLKRAKQAGQLVLLPPERIFADENGALLRLNDRDAGGSGRRKLCFADWDQDGRLDLLVNSESVSLLRNLGYRRGKHIFQDIGRVDKDRAHSRRLAGHSTSPTIVDWDHDGIADLLVGSEDGHLYYLRNSSTK